MNFEKDLVFFDLETTGTDTIKDRIVEICMIKVTKEGGFSNREIKTKLVNPCIPIPKGASDVHGITDDKVKDSPTFKQLATGILSFIEGCDIVGYNSINFDIPLLYNEFARAGMRWNYDKINFIDVCNIFKIKEARTLTAAMKFYVGEDHEDAHGAEADTEATIDVFMSQVIKYRLGEMTFKELALMSNYDKPILDISGKFSVDGEGDVIFNFGLHKGKKAKSEKSYLLWMRDKGTFSQDTLSIVTKLLS